MGRVKRRIVQEEKDLMETEATYSDSYITVERMIRRGELSLSELEHVLESLLRQKNITSTEGEALLELAWGMKTEHKSSAAL